MHHAIQPTGRPAPARQRAELSRAADLGSADAAYRGRMLTRARRIVVDPDLAEDVVQEAFLRAWRARGSFDADGPPLVNWLLVITANTAVDMVKARVRRPQPTGIAQPDAAGADDIELLLLRVELRDALQRIGAHHREALVETVLRDRPYADVADELGISVGTLRSRVHYALRRLRGLLDPIPQPA